MKYIHPNQGSFDGSVHYLVQNQGYIPQFQTNCNISKDSVREFFSHPETSNFYLDIDEKNTSNKNAYFIIHFENHKIIPIAYEFSVVKDTSPPTSWSFSASNDPENEWFLLDERLNRTLCSNSSMPNYEHQCGERVAHKFYLKQTAFLGPFQYFKFTLYQNRASNQLFDIRMGGFDIYGGLYGAKESIFYRCTCNYEKPPLSIAFFAICLTYSHI